MRCTLTIFYKPECCVMCDATPLLYGLDNYTVETAAKCNSDSKPRGPQHVPCEHAPHRLSRVCTESRLCVTHGVLSNLYS